MGALHSVSMFLSPLNTSRMTQQLFLLCKGQRATFELASFSTLWIIITNTQCKQKEEVEFLCCHEYEKQMLHYLFSHWYIKQSRTTDALTQGGWQNNVDACVSTGNSECRLSIIQRMELMLLRTLSIMVNQQEDCSHVVTLKATGQQLELIQSAGLQM